MATRDDVVVDFYPSPRIAIVESPSVEFNVQDIVDTLRKREDTFRGQAETKLLNASGKEDLGGGVQVGITAELQDTQVAFEGNTTVAQSGTVTTASGTPIANSPPRKNGIIELIDINADFISNNIQRGSLVINFTDQSIAEVYRVDSPTSLWTRTLVNGSDNSFDIGDVYQIYNVVQCELIGGNLVGVDENGNGIIPVSPTAFTQVIRTASSSATLLGGNFPTANENAQAVWEYDAENVVAGSHGEISRRSSFHEIIHVDKNNGAAGTAWPLGTATAPVNNIADAVTIGIREGIYHMEIEEDIDILATDNVDGFIVQGSHATKSEIAVAAGASTTFTEFRDCYLTGTLDGQIVVRDSFVEDLLDIEGVLYNVLINGTISLAGTTPTYILSCYSAHTAGQPPEIDFNGAGQTLIVRGFSGDLKFVNKTGTETICMDFETGRLVIDGTVTAGEMQIRGIYELEDNSTGSPGLNIIQNTNLDNIELKVDNVQIDVDAIEVTVSNIWQVVSDLIKYQRNRSLIDPTAYTLTIYDDDGTTPLTVFDLKDSAGVASVLNIYERIPLGSP